MKKSVILVGLCLAPLGLTACMPTQGPAAAAASPTIQDALDAWKGRKSDDLIVAWGPPQGQVQLPHGGTMLTYVATKTIEGQDMSGLGHVLGMGSASGLLNASGTVSNFDCTVNVKLSPRSIIEQAVVAHVNNPVLQNLCDFVKPPVV